MSKPLPICVAIPTYGREDVLVATIRQFLEQAPRAAEILVVDQTPLHETATDVQLSRWHEDGAINWIRLLHPSQPGALNVALRQARQPILLFLDDDIRIEPGFVAAHARHYANPDVWAVAGQVLQPGEAPLQGYEHKAGTGPFADFHFPFRSATPGWIANGMSGNLSVRRDRALAIGGFDENFLPPVSYRFDNDFCRRIVRAGGKIYFDPEARIHHLRAERGGTRSSGSHLTSASPKHGQGDYYFALKQGLSMSAIGYLLRRPFREVRTRFHLRHPWWIPVKLLGEFRALLQAVSLHIKGPTYLRDHDRS